MKINAGAFKSQTQNDHKYKIYIKNVNIYKTAKWTSFFIIINNIRYKCINSDELQSNNIYCIELCNYNNRPSLVWNNMIIYQQDTLFSYSVEFIMNTDVNTDIDVKTDSIYEYVVKELCTDTDNFRYLN